MSRPWAALMVLGLAGPLWAADPPPVDEAALFGATVLREIDPAQVQSGTVSLVPGAPTPAVSTVRWGGSADAGINGQWHLDPGPWPGFDRGGAAVNAVVYLDARPTDTARFYAETAVTQDLEKGTSYKARELFLDTAWDKAVSFRVGKQRIAWGVGTWFSPADILSLESIELNDPGRKREGPWALKTTVPWGLQAFTLYTVLPQSPGVGGTAFAPRVELLIGTLELAIAGYWRPDASLRPRGMVLTTGALGPFNLSHESVVLWGSDRHWVRVRPNGSLEVWGDQQTLFYQGAFGAGWSWTSPEQDASLNLQGQYFFDSTGYEDPSVLIDRASAVRKLSDQGTLTTTDLSNPGRHYAVASISVGKLWGDTVNPGGTGWVNLSDRSFRVAPSVTLKPWPPLSLRLQFSWDEGVKGSQYAPSGRTLTPGLKLGLFDTTTVEIQAPWRSSGTDLKASVSFQIPSF